MVGVIHHVFLRRGETITADRYSAESLETHHTLVPKHPAMINRHSFLMMHDNTRPYVAQRTVQALHELQYETLSQPPHSSDLSPTDYHLLQHINHFLAGMTFPDDRVVQHAIEDFFTSQTPDFLRHGIQSLVYRWQQCVTTDCDYFD